MPKLLKDSIKIGEVSLDISYCLVGVGSLTKKQFDNLIISKKSSKLTVSTRLVFFVISYFI